MSSTARIGWRPSRRRCNQTASNAGTRKPKEPARNIWSCCGSRRKRLWWCCPQKRRRNFSAPTESTSPMRMSVNKRKAGMFGSTLRRRIFDQQRDARFLPAIHGNINGVGAGLFKFELLNAHHEVARGKMAAFGNRDIHLHVNARQDQFPVVIHEIQ